MPAKGELSAFLVTQMVGSSLKLLVLFSSTQQDCIPKLKKSLSKSQKDLDFIPKLEKCVGVMLGFKV